MVVDLNEMKSNNEQETKLISWEDFQELNKNDEYCFEIDRTRITDEFDEYFYSLNLHAKDMERELRHSEKIPVFKKNKFTLTSRFVLECIQDYLEDNYGYDSYENDTLENKVGLDTFDDACEKFNDMFQNTYYIAGEKQDFYLNLKEDIKERMKEELQ